MILSKFLVEKIEKILILDKSSFSKKSKKKSEGDEIKVEDEKNPMLGKLFFEVK